MKNKKLTYLLLVIVLAVWGIIFWRIFFVREPADVPPDVHPAAESNQIASIDMELRLDYRDPFLEEKKTRAILAENHGTPEEPVPEAEPMPPPLQYKGVIQRGKNTYALISAGMTTELAARGDVVQGYKLTAITPDSITLQKDKHRFILYLQ